MLSPELRRNIEKATAQLVADRLATGQSRAQIRCEAARVAAGAIAEVVGDQWEQETVMAQITRGIEKALIGGE
jgi:hypothetical protein